MLNIRVVRSIFRVDKSIFRGIGVNIGVVRVNIQGGLGSTFEVVRVQYSGWAGPIFRVDRVIFGVGGQGQHSRWAESIFRWAGHIQGDRVNIRVGRVNIRGGRVNIRVDRNNYGGGGVGIYPPLSYYNTL